MKLLEEINANWAVATETQKLQARVWQLAREEGLKTILVTSALRGEGKSTTVAHLGVMLALNPQRRVLIVDLDLRGPRQHGFFDVPREPGLTEVILDGWRVGEAISQTEFSNLQLLTAGRADRPEEVLNSPRLMPTMAELRNGHDIVIVDTPAMIPVADASELMGIADGVILVVMAGKTPKASLMAARDLCLGMKVNLLGLVVNNAMEAVPEIYRTQHYYTYQSHEKSSPRRARTRPEA